MKKIKLEEENKTLKKAYKELNQNYIKLYSKYRKEKKNIEELGDTILTIVFTFVLGYLGITLFAWLIKLTIKFWLGLF